METATFDKIRSLVYQQSGIDLAPGKEPLVRGRLGKRMRALGIADEAQYLRHVLNDASGDELVRLLDAISTNFTHFFREQDHFRVLESACREKLAENRGGRFRVWSAACSSGEEPYSIAMTILDSLADSPGDARILATDISTRVLAQAVEGKYRQEEVSHIPAALRGQYFEHSRGPEPIYQANEALRRMVTFRRMNLSKPPFPMQGPFDLIFCRNVMIYFDNTVRSRLLLEIERLLSPGGWLLVGHTESLAGIATGLKMISPSVYRKGARQ